MTAGSELGCARADRIGSVHPGLPVGRTSHRYLPLRPRRLEKGRKNDPLPGRVLAAHGSGAEGDIKCPTTHINSGKNLIDPRFSDLCLSGNVIGAGLYHTHIRTHAYREIHNSKEKARSESELYTHA